LRVVTSCSRFDDEHSIVTGGSAGIGIESARAVAMAGAAVALAVRRPDAGDADHGLPIFTRRHPGECRLSSRQIKQAHGPELAGSA
jgi:NAD(P)-dependent dehydrogenase (short-subunit alcohol dehydrogenase family)